MRQILFTISFLCICSLAFAQEVFRISGTVFNESGESLPGASVHIHENMKATYTDEHGYFVLENVKPGKYHLHIRSLGYHSTVLVVNVVNEDLSIKIDMEVSPNELHAITIEGSGHEDEKAQSSLMIERVDQERILENSSGNLMQGIQEIPGINTINTGVGVGKPVIRGLSQNRVVVSEGGIKQEGQQWGNDHGLEVDQYSIEGVEIVKGPASLAYGSDALGGVINISRPEVLPQGSKKFYANSIYKSNNDHFGLSAGLKGNKKGLVYQGNMSLQSFGDYRVPANSFTYNDFVLPINNGRLKNTAGEEVNFGAMLGIQRNWVYSQLKYSSFNQRIGVFPGAIGIPTSISLEHDGDYRNIDLPYQDISHQKVLWNSTIYTKSGWFEVDLGFQRNLRKEFSIPHAHGRPLDFSTDLAHQLDLRTYSSNLKYKWNLSETTDLIFGNQSSLLINEIDGFEFIIPPYTQINSGFYLLFRRQIRERTVLNAGVRYDLSYFNIEGSTMDFYSRGDFKGNIVRNPEIDENYRNYSAAIGLNHSLNDVSHVRLNIGKTFRIPNVAELSSNGVHHGAFRYEQGDETLKPEEGYQFDLGFDLEHGKFYFDLSLFANYFDNYIYLSPTGEFPTVEINDTVYSYPGPGQLYRYKQAPAFHTGGEFNLHFDILSSTSIDVKAEYVYIENLNTSLPVSFTPPPSLKFNLEQGLTKSEGLLRRTYIRLSYLVYAAQDRVDQNELPTSGYELVNLLLGSKIGKKERFDLKFSVQNLFDRYYLAHLSRYRPLNIPEPGRNVVVAFTYNLDAR